MSVMWVCTGKVYVCRLLRLKPPAPPLNLRFPLPWSPDVPLFELGFSGTRARDSPETSNGQTLRCPDSLPCTHALAGLQHSPKFP